MPELPEVETTRRGIAPYLEGRRIRSARVREPRLRWPVATNLGSIVEGQQILKVSRRGKYLLLRLETGTVILHLGMSGSLRVLPPQTPPDRHDHVDLLLDDEHCLRLRDPRRFGALLWTRGDPLCHRLLRTLGPEPLGAAFNGEWLYHHARGRRTPVKAYLMDSRIVVGVGNIYANEALFVAGIHPARQAGRISVVRYSRLADAAKEILAGAIAAGGTTLRDFVNSDGRPGYFSQHLLVYGRNGEPCEVCGRLLRRRMIGQRSSYYCVHCQA